MERLYQRLHSSLCNRADQGRLRALSVVPQRGVDFYSNDYLGFARNKELQDRLRNIALENPDSLMGATGARLISGDSLKVREVEAYIAKQHQVEKALLMPSGYTANLSLFSVLPKKGDTILLDECVHRSVYDGCRLSQAKRWKFRHNNMGHLEELLKRSSAQVWVAVESLYSMQGDYAPLRELVTLTELHGAALLVDEAHAIGTFGLGLLNVLNLQQRVFASIVTYGKAMGFSGAAILGSDILIQYLINYAAPFIYSTSVPDFHALAVQEVYHFLLEERLPTTQLKEVIACFNALGLAGEAAVDSPIKPIKFNGLGTLDTAVKLLKENGLQSYAIKVPTVAAAEECIRISLHAFNKPADIHLLGDIINSFTNE